MARRDPEGGRTCRRPTIRLSDPGRTTFSKKFTIKNYHAWKIALFSDVPSLSALRDWIINLAGFVPFGWLVVKSRQPHPGLFLAIVLSSALSFTIELGQLLLFNDRAPSTEDVIMNTLGAALGAWIATQSALRANAAKTRVTI